MSTSFRRIRLVLARFQVPQGRKKALRVRERRMAPRYFLESAAQIASMVPSWLKPFGHAGVRVLAEYQLSLAPDSGFTGPFVNMRPPGISRKPLRSCSLSQPQA